MSLPHVIVAIEFFSVVVANEFILFVLSNVLITVVAANEPILVVLFNGPIYVVVANELMSVVEVNELISVVVANEPTWFVGAKASISVLVANVRLVLVEKPNSGVVSSDPMSGLVVLESLLYRVDNIFHVSAPSRIVFRGPPISLLELLNRYTNSTTNLELRM